MRRAVVLSLEGLLLIAGFLYAQSSYQQIASPKQIMAAIQGPAMNAIIAVNKAGGPKDEKEWDQVGASAAALAESSQLLLLGDRPSHEAVKKPDNGDPKDIWIQASKKLETAAAGSAKAAQAKDLEAWKASVNAIGGACRSCHTVHRPPQKKAE